MRDAPLPDRELLERIANALEDIAAKLPAERLASPDLTLGPADAYHWEAATGKLLPVDKVNRVPLDLLKGVDSVKAPLLQNPRQFARGYGANNVLLWGARGMGKSSLVKAVHAEISGQHAVAAARLVLIEINREDIES